jgi:hypothetical protein
MYPKTCLEKVLFYLVERAPLFNLVESILMLILMVESRK